VDVVTASAEVAFLGNYTVLTNANLVKAVENDIIANPTVIANFHFPGKGEAGGGADNHTFADFGTEQPQEGAAPAVDGMGSQGERDRLHQPPDQYKPAWSSPVKPRLVVAA